MQKYIGTAIKKDVNNPSPAGETPAVNVDVRVVVTSTGAPANIYSDNGVTIIDQNTYKTDANGNHEFYAANGRYTIRYLLASGTIEYTDVVLEDPDDRKATQAQAEAGTDDSQFMTPLKTQQQFDKNASEEKTYNLSPTSLFRKQDSNLEGGEVRIETADNSTVDGPVVIDVFSNDIRFRESSGSVRGVFLNFDDCEINATSELFHSGILASLQNVSGATVTSNATVAGSSLNPAKTGTWRNVSGNDILNNDYGLFKRE